MCGTLINFSSSLYEYICINLMHFKESLCLAWLSCKESSMLQFKTYTVCLSMWFFLPVFCLPEATHHLLEISFCLLQLLWHNQKRCMLLLTSELYIYIFKWLFLITLSQPRKDMTLLTSELYKNGITQHNAFRNCLFTHSIVFGNWVLLLFLTSDQSFPLSPFHQAKTEQMDMYFHQRTLKLFPFLASVSNAAVSIVKCLLAHLNGIYLKYTRASKIARCL